MANSPKGNPQTPKTTTPSPTSKSGPPPKPTTPPPKPPPSRPLPPTPKSTAPPPLPPRPQVTVLPDGKLVVPRGGKFVAAKAGQCFCDFASMAGFKDCAPLRRVNTHLAEKATLETDDQVAIPDKTQKTTSGANETVVQSKRVNFPVAAVRFVGQGTTLNQRGPGLRRLGISNYRTDKASAIGAGTENDFYKLKGADDDTARASVPDEVNTYADPDHFRVEVHDVTAAKAKKASVQVELQVLQPLYVQADGTRGQTVIRRDLKSRPDPNVPAGFKVPTNAKRKLTVECYLVGKTPYYRSKYLRLVTFDKDEVANHTLFVGDYFDDGANDQEKWYTEILEQKVRALYKPEMCTPGKCRVESLADVGELRAEVRLAVHVMDNCVSYAEVRRVVYKQVRRVYASVHVRPYIRRIYHHPPPKNILLVGDLGGTAAPPTGISGLIKKVGTAFSASKIKLKLDGTDYEHKLAANQTVAQVAGQLTGLLAANGFQVKEVKDPAVPGNGLEAARLLLIFRDAAFTDYAELTSATSDDTRLSVQNVDLSSALLGAYPQDDKPLYHRVLKALCDTKWFDAIILKAFDATSSTLFGIATWIHQEFSPCIIVQSDRVKPALDDRCTFSHEIGHVVMHGGHFQDAARQEQIMLVGGQVVGDANEMPGRRRVMDAPMEMPWEPFDDAAGTWTGPHDLGSGKPHGTLVSRIHKFLKGQPFGPPSTDREIATEW